MGQLRSSLASLAKLLLRSLSRRVASQQVQTTCHMHSARMQPTRLRVLLTRHSAACAQTAALSHERIHTPPPQAAGQGPAPVQISTGSTQPRWRRAWTGTCTVPRSSRKATGKETGSGATRASSCCTTAQGARRNGELHSAKTPAQPCSSRQALCLPVPLGSLKLCAWLRPGILPSVLIS